MTGHDIKIKIKKTFSAPCVYFLASYSGKHRYF